MRASKEIPHRLKVVGFLSLALSGLWVPYALRADDTNVMSSVVKYQYADSMNVNGSMLLSPIVSFRYLESPGPLTEVTIQGPTTIQGGQLRRFRAFAHFADGTTQEEVTDYSEFNEIKEANKSANFFSGNRLFTQPVREVDDIAVFATYRHVTGTRTSPPYPVTITLTFTGTVFTRMRKYRGHDAAQRSPEARPRVVMARVARTLRAYKNSVAGRINPANRLDTAEVAENRPRCLYLLPPPA